MKRKRKDSACITQAKKRRIAAPEGLNGTSNLSHPVLQYYYPTLLSLRQYLLSRLPAASKRRRRLLSDALIQELDTVLVGCRRIPSAEDGPPKIKDLQQLSQQLSATNPSTKLDEGCVSQAEIVDFCVWLLFNKSYPHVHRPPHILCHGTQRASATWQNGLGISSGCGIPGLFSVIPNEYLETLKGPPWQDIMTLLGKAGGQIMIDLLVDCALFTPMDGLPGNLYQLSGKSTNVARLLNLLTALGTPLTNLDILPPKHLRCPYQSVTDALESKTRLKSCASKLPILRKASEIRFVRNRMYYARAALNAKGEVSFGLRHIHVFNRFPDSANLAHTVHIMKHLFPRQFGLHNVFTSHTNAKDTVQPFKDYSLREHEIAQSDRTIRVPKRLRGRLMTLIYRLQKLHKHCSYTKLLTHYCPLQEAACNLTSSRQVSRSETACKSQPGFTDVATSSADVSVYCRAVLASVFPKKLFGEGTTQQSNVKVLMRNVDAFIRGRRFESMTLESFMVQMKIADIEWLCPPHQTPGQHMAISDFWKRQEIFMELIYYIFDSFLIPLVRSNFHVTESATHRHRLFFFRHDVWRRLTEPTLTTLKLSTFEEVGSHKIKSLLDKRPLGFSQVRLLPKENGMRPISNLRRRTQVLQNGSPVLNRSINSVLAPVFNILDYEKSHQRHRLGSSLFSVGDMYSRIRSFRETSSNVQNGHRQLYFAKVDVKACFDSIPQDALMTLAQDLLSANDYDISRHAEIKPSDIHENTVGSHISKPSKKFCAIATVGAGYASFPQAIEQSSKSRRSNTVFVDSVVTQSVKKKQALKLLSEHVQQNILKIGKKFYRQKKGIPQGSVLSSLLCNFFYADFEQKELGFLNNGDSLLLRLIDDFLLITTSRANAVQFLETMHGGSIDYGITIKAEKSLTNFEVELNGISVARVPEHTKFPYCGVLIDSRNLNISKDSSRLKHGTVADTLTVEYSRTPGHNYRRKIFNALKLQTRTMLLDTSHNSLFTVLRNLYAILMESATKSYHYVRCLRASHRNNLDLLRRTIEDMSALVFAIVKSKRHKLRSPTYHCGVNSNAVTWLTSTAFMSVLQPKQTRHKELLNWLAQEIAKSQPKSQRELSLMQQVVV